MFTLVYFCYFTFFVFCSCLSVLLLPSFVFEIVLHTFVHAQTIFLCCFAPHHTLERTVARSIKQIEHELCSVNFRYFDRFSELNQFTGHFIFVLFFFFFCFSKYLTLHICIRRWRPMRTNEPKIILVSRLTKPI